MSGELYQFLIVFATGLLGIWKAVPVGFALGLDPVWIYLFTVLGAIVAALIIFFFGDAVRKFLQKRKKSEKKETRARHLFNKYGTAGLGFLGCVIMGPNMTLVIGLILVRSPRKLLWFTIAGIVFWSLVLTVTASLGLNLFGKFSG